MADAASDRLRKIRINSLKLNGKVPELKIEIITKKDMRIEVTKSISEVRRLAEFLKSIDRPIQKKLPPQVCVGSLPTHKTFTCTFNSGRIVQIQVNPQINIG